MTGFFDTIHVTVACRTSNLTPYSNVSARMHLLFCGSDTGGLFPQRTKLERVLLLEPPATLSRIWYHFQRVRLVWLYGKGLPSPDIWSKIFLGQMVLLFLQFDASWLRARIAVIVRTEASGSYHMQILDLVK